MTKGNLRAVNTRYDVRQTELVEAFLKVWKNLEELRGGKNLSKP